MAESECALEPTPFLPKSSVLGEVLIPVGTRYVSSMDGNLAAAALSPGGVFASRNKSNKEVDLHHFHVPLAHAHSSFLKATTQQHGIYLVGKLGRCSGYLQGKEIRPATPHLTTARAQALIEVVNTDTTGPYPESLEDSHVIILFVDSASHL